MSADRPIADSCAAWPRMDLDEIMDFSTDGKIAAWRDYFDMAMFMKEFDPPGES